MDVPEHLLQGPLDRDLHPLSSLHHPHLNFQHVTLAEALIARLTAASDSDAYTQSKRIKTGADA